MNTIVNSPMKKVHWSEAMQEQCAVRLWCGDDGQFQPETVVAAEPGNPGVVLVTSRGETVRPDEAGLVAVVDHVEPLKILARLPDDSYVTLVQWIRRRDDLRRIQPLDAGGGRMTMNMIAAQDWHPLRVRIESGYVLPVEVVHEV